MKINLKTLFNHGVYPSEEIVPLGWEYRAVNEKIGERKRFFVEKMSPDDVQRFEELENLYFESSAIYACDCFVYGFKLGALLMDEVCIG